MTLAIPYRLAPQMCHAIGCLESCAVGASVMCRRHWEMLSFAHQDALAQMLPGALREAMTAVARKEGR